MSGTVCTRVSSSSESGRLHSLADHQEVPALSQWWLPGGVCCRTADAGQAVAVCSPTPKTSRINSTGGIEARLGRIVLCVCTVGLVALLQRSISWHWNVKQLWCRSENKNHLCQCIEIPFFHLLPIIMCFWLLGIQVSKKKAKNATCYIGYN